VARAAPLLQPLKHTKTPNDNPAAASTSGKPGNFLSRLRTGLMPAIGSNSNASAIAPGGPPGKGIAPCAVGWLTVWTVMVTAVSITGSLLIFNPGSKFTKGRLGPDIAQLRRETA
jgi:hypothetical protein